MSIASDLFDSLGLSAVQQKAGSDADFGPLVVRLKTCVYNTSRGLHMRRDILYMKRYRCGYNLLEEEAALIGADEVLPRITNLDACKDGLYIVRTCNERKDWETGYVEEYDYVLVPFNPDNQ